MLYYLYYTSVHTILSDVHQVVFDASVRERSGNTRFAMRKYILGDIALHKHWIRTPWDCTAIIYHRMHVEQLKICCNLWGGASKEVQDARRCRLILGAGFVAGAVACLQQLSFAGSRSA